jgi:ectoine hydroxylase-related dioxygenase (phytanoyl-CoA dioxygenase family)
MKSLDVQKDFKLNGYYVARGVVPENLIKKTRERILQTIKDCSQDIAVSQNDYLSSVSRWVSPSPITSAVTNSLLEHVSQATQNLLGETPHLSKFNVICKNNQCRDAVPYHQDISYSPENPYQVSAWLALQDVPDDAGPLEVIPGSHKEPLKSAVDFWSPEYKPDPSLKMRARKLPLFAGDVVFFDSSLWHGSSENLARISRYAIVTRWTTKTWQPPQLIPPIKPSYFGMWTSGELTQEILSQGAHLFFQSKGENFVKLLELWIDKLQQISLPFSLDKGLVIESLKQIKILHLAHLKHNGGDATGNLYKNLWQSFLCPLKTYVETIEPKREAL